MAGSGSYAELARVEQERLEREARAKTAAPISAPAKTGAAPNGQTRPLPTGAAPKMEPAPEQAGLWFPTFNAFWDSLAPTLEPIDVAVLGHLMRLTVGWQNRPTCTIGFPALARRCNSGVNTVRRSVVRLETRGLVRVVETENRGHNRTRGSVYELLFATPVTGGAAKSAPAKMGPAKTARAETGGMISEKRHEENAPKYRLRTIGARLLEAHPAYDAAQLKREVVDEAACEGIAYTAADLAAALAPLVKS